MTRDSNIPLFLWIATAVLAHLMWGGGVNKMSRMIEETLDIKRFAFEVRERVRGTGNVEVTLLDEQTDETKPDDQKTDEAKKDDEQPADDEEESKNDEDSKKDEADLKKEEDKKQQSDKVEPPKPEPQKLEIKVEEKKKEEEALKEIPKPDSKKRIAVVQHVEDKNQKDNPNAEFIADEANTVKEQSQARITSTDQNDPKPTPGGAHAGPTKNPGDSDESRVAQSEDKPGVPDKAPTPDEPTADKPHKTASAAPPPPPPSPASQPERKAPGSENGSTASKSASKEPGQKGQKAQSAREEVEASPDTLNSGNGSWGVGQARAAQEAQKAHKARKKRLPPMKGAGGANDLLGLGAAGTTASGVNLNLTPKQALAAVGRDRLVKERKQDAERRKSAHRGSWQSLGIERWRSAIENYVPSVKPGNQTALNTARVPFASYLNAVHNRLHPIFADSFLASLDSLPGSHPMNRPEIKTDLEIVLTKDEGRVVRMGVTHTSGVTAFDIAALESVMRAQPFGPPPNEIVSPDGNVYFHWEFYRNPYYACSTYFAHPFILKAAPKNAPPNIEPSPWRPLEPKEGPPSGGGPQRHGFAPRPGVQLERHAALR